MRGIRMLRIPKLNYMILCVSAIFIFACTTDSTINKSLKLVWDKAGKPSDKLIVFLPGIFDTAESFKKEQFFKLAREAGITADMVAAGTNVRHLINNNLVERLNTDIFSLAKNQGYQKIWLVGISLGGLSSLLYYKEKFDGLCGVALFAPYLANNALYKRIIKSGGIKAWKSEPSNDAETMSQQSLWQWLKQQQDKNNLEYIYLGYGKQDRFVGASKLLTELLNKNNVVSLEGKHNWETWRKIWQRQLANRNKNGFLQACK